MTVDKKYSNQKKAKSQKNFSSSEKIDNLAKVLAKQIDQKIFERKYAPAKNVLLLIGAGAFLAASIAMPNLPLVLKPFLDKKRKEEREVWKRFNIPYLKRTLQRLENQKLVQISEENGKQIVKITNKGRKKIHKFSLDTLEIKKPKFWDRKWRLISYDLPVNRSLERQVFIEYLRKWNFYPLHESVYLHAYPCLNEIDFLRDYLGIGEYVRLFIVTSIENDKLFRDFFGV